MARAIEQRFATGVVMSFFAAPTAIALAARGNPLKHTPAT
jgi:hypothetical protein